MTYVVTDACIRCKYMDCVEVCPVDCFYEGDNMLVINPNECIDCGVCEPECPAEAILPDTEGGLEKWLELNATFSTPSIISMTRKISPSLVMPQSYVATQFLCLRLAETSPSCGRSSPRSSPPPAPAHQE